MTCEAKVIADSVSPEGKRITTMQLKYWRAIHAEFMTHRVFSRNASSSRAIPVAKMIEQVRTDPAGPIHWGANQAGMQAGAELTGNQLEHSKIMWRLAATQAAEVASRMMELGLHKQVANRILEPFQWIHVIVTATEFDNFFALRNHPDAQPEIKELAVAMKAAMNESTPELLREGEWHLPYVSEDERAELGEHLACQVSAARCCRVSYLKHDGTRASIREDLALCDRLAGADPIHASPFEHQATPDKFVEQWCGDADDTPNTFEDWDKPMLHGNLDGWIQYRKVMEEAKG